MAKQKDYSEFHYFAYIANNPAFGFSTYRDAETGMPTGYVIGYDKLGRPEYKFWQFNYDSQRMERGAGAGAVTVVDGLLDEDAVSVEGGAVAVHAQALRSATIGPYRDP